MAINALTNEGDSVLIQNPVYYPFTEVIIDNNRKLVNNSLVRNGKKYEIDFEDFEKKIMLSYLFYVVHIIQLVESGKSGS